MRPTTMLQQNNNNNYPCLNVSGSTREMLQKCSRASLPFPSRLELGDLPLIRGLRAWALCSKNRRKAGGLLGGGQAPAAPPASRSGLTSCPRPADVYLSGEWGRMGYGLPLGLDAGQTGIGALVTVATLKTSEGSGKTQTQCLFLRTEKGSCLYSTAKPASTVVGGWLRGKTGGGGSRDTPAGRRDHGPSAQTGANRVRVRSGRRWRKSCNAAAGREKAGVSRERQQDTAGEIALEERQEGGPESKQSPSPQQDIRRPLRSPRCCHNASPKTCSQCGRRAPRRENQDDHEGGESPRRGRLNGEVKAMRKDREKKEEEEEEKGDPDPESNCCHAESHSGRGGEEISEISEGMKTQTSHNEGERSEKVEDSYSGPPEPNDFGSRQNREFEDTKPVENVCEEIAPNGNGFSDHAEAVEGSEKDLEEEGSIKQAPNEVSVIPASPESSAPIGGSTCTADHKSVGALREQDNRKEVSDCEIMGKEELDFSAFEQQDATCAADEINSEKQLLCLEEDVESSVRLEEGDASSSPLRHAHSSIPERDGRILTENSGGEDRGDEPAWENREKESRVENIEQRVKPAGVGNAFWGRESICDEWHAEEDIDDRTEHAATQNCALDDGWRLQESADVLQDGGTSGRASSPQTNRETGTDVTNVACADPSTSPVLAPANPAPSLPPLGSMATSLPRLEAAEEEEEEGEGLVVTAGDGGGEGGQEGKRRHGRELEQQGEEERGSTVATEEARKEEEEEEDEFGVFMQAEGEPAWSEGSTMPASVPCGSRESVALGNHAMSGESTLWTPGWTDSSFHQSDDSWSAFPQDSSAERRDVVGQWWPTSAVEESRVRLLTNHSLASVFAEAFPSLPASSSSDACDLDTVPTLTQLLRGKASQDQGLLDSFHDLNKMICQRYKRANGASRDLLLKTLHLEQPHTESRPAPRTVNRRLSPGLPSANQHAQNAAAKRRLSYDYNRNIME